MDRRVGIAFLHPLWLSAAGVASSAALLGTALVERAFDLPGSLFPTSWPFALAVTLSLASSLLLPLAWSHGILRAARLVLQEESVSRKSDWTFWLAGAGCTLLTLACPVIMMSEPEILRAIGFWPKLVGVAVAAAYVISFWTTASTLVRLEGGQTGTDDRAAGTFILLLYWLVGAWFLRARLLALKAALPAPAVTAA